MHAEFDFDGDVALVTGGCGALGAAVVEGFAGAGATVCVTDVVEPGGDEAVLGARDDVSFYPGDLTDPGDAAEVVASVVEDHGGLDCLANVAGTWAGGDPIEETAVGTFDAMFDVNLKTMFLATREAIPHLRADDRQGAVVSVSARSSLEGGAGDGPYRAAKAGVRLLTETVAEENTGSLRANAVMPSVIDTPANREMMPDADHESWVAPADIADVVLFLCSDAAAVTSGAAVPVYGQV